MYAVEFETDIKGNTVQIPTHILNRISKHRHVKIILLMPEDNEIELSKSDDPKTELMQIGKRCATLPLLDKRSPDEILGYNQDGLPS